MKKASNNKFRNKKKLRKNRQYTAERRYANFLTPYKFFKVYPYKNKNEKSEWEQIVLFLDHC